MSKTTTRRPKPADQKPNDSAQADDQARDQAEDEARTPATIPAVPPAPPAKTPLWFLSELQVTCTNHGMSLRLNAESSLQGFNGKLLQRLDAEVLPALQQAARDYLAGSEPAAGYEEACKVRDQVAAKLADARQRQEVAGYRARALIRNDDPKVFPPPGTDAATASVREMETADAAKVEADRYAKMLGELDADLAKRRPAIHANQRQAICEAYARLRAEAQKKVAAAAARALETIIQDDPVAILMVSQLMHNHDDSLINRAVTIPNQPSR